MNDDIQCEEIYVKVPNYKDVAKYSLFIVNKNKRNEIHDIKWIDAMEEALTALYNVNGEINCGVQVEIRDDEKIVYTAKNPER